MKTSQILAAATVLAMVMMGTACTAAKDSDPTPVTHFKITPAARGQTPSATATAASKVTPAATSAAGSTVAIKTSGSTLQFDQNKLTATVGAVTIAFDNQDAGVAHNISVYEGKDATGKTLGKTDIEAGPVKQELKLDLSAGSYFFQCDVHPTTMNGSLAVR